MLSFKLNESSNFEFNMQINGEVEGSPEVMFVINEGSRRIALPAKTGEHGQYAVVVPELEGSLKHGEYLGEIWVVIGDRIFKPLSERVEFKEAVKPVVSALKEDVKPMVSVTAATIVTRPTQVEEVKKTPKTTAADEDLVKRMLKKTT